MIPKIIHQYDVNDIQISETIYAKRLQNQYPDFQYMLWTKERLISLLEKYPRYKNVNIRQIDPFIILYEYGGIYLEIPMEIKFDALNDILEQEYIITKHLIAGHKGHNKWSSIMDALANNMENIEYHNDSDLVFPANPLDIRRVDLVEEVDGFLAAIVVLSVIGFVMLVVIIILSVLLSKTNKRTT